MRKTLLLILIIGLFTVDGFSQAIDKKYIPVTINSPLFNHNDELQFGANVNNYGLNFKYSGQLDDKILIISVQQNTGIIKFDPLHFNRNQTFESSDLIQSLPSKMLYGEIGFGYNFKLKTQKLSFIAGLGQQLDNPNTRLFTQLDWGNESRIINAGVSLRANYTIINHLGFFTLEPVIQGKVKIKKFRIVNQFGYSIIVKEDHDYAKPILTIGLEYIVEN